MPFTLRTTAAQEYALLKLYERHKRSDGYDGETYEHFRGRVSEYDEYIGLSLWGMFIGIERDGYAHS